MRSELALLGGLLYVSLGCSLVFLYYCLRHREKRGATPLAAVFVGMLLWVAADIIQLHTPANPLPAVGIDLRLLGPDIAVAGFLVFSLEYTGRERLVRPATIAVLAIKPAVALGVYLSPLRSELLTVPADETMRIGYDLASIPAAPWHAMYNWLLIVIAFGLLTHMMFRADQGYRRQIVAVLLAFTVPFILNLLFFGGWLPVDLTSASFLVTASVVMYATFQLRLMDTLPVARQKALEEMEDMVIVLDEQGMVISVNRATRERFGEDAVLEGKPAAELFGTALPDGGTADGIFELAATIDGQQRHLEINSSTLQDYRENLLGQVLVCRDVTERERTAAALRRREEELELLKDIQSRFLRHNLRNELNVVRLEADRLRDEDDPEQREQYRTILAKTDRILEWGEKARTIEKLLETEQRLVYDLDGKIQQVVNAMRDTYPAATIEVDLEDGLWVHAVPQVEHAIENLVDNAIRHNPGRAPSVWITGRRTAEAVVVEVRDDGPGIDDVELASLREGQEGAMTHGSGFGLWLVYWVLDKSGGDVDFETDDGTTVRLLFDPAAVSADGTPTGNAISDGDDLSGDGRSRDGDPDGFRE